MNWTIHLPFTKPPDGLSANSRHHWRAKARSTAEVRQLVAGLARGFPKTQRIQVELVWIVNDKRKRDDDNLAPLAKACWDALASDRGVSANLVPDDSPEYVTKMHPRIEYKPGVKPHFELRIKDISNRPDVINDVVTERL